MHLAEVLALRSVPAAGLFMMVTRRCPLSCEHCSTNSGIGARQYDDGLFLRFADTFTPENRPQVVLMTGGEPLLRPRLVTEISRRCRTVGTRVCLISGMYFANMAEIPDKVLAAVRGLDHFTASLDVFHEREVPRRSVFQALNQIRGFGVDVSLQITGKDAADPYLTDLIAEARAWFGDEVPMLVVPLAPSGRSPSGADGEEGCGKADGGTAVGAAELEPCDMAAWPVIAEDGAIVGCCNQRVVDGPAPSHLSLGHVVGADWPSVKASVLESESLRALRVYGPRYLRFRYGGGLSNDSGYCSTCRSLSQDARVSQAMHRLSRRPAMKVLEPAVRLAQGTQVYGMSRYSALTRLGHRSDDSWERTCGD